MMCGLFKGSYLGLTLGSPFMSQDWQESKLYIYIYILGKCTNLELAQSAGAVEYTDCFSVDGQNLSKRVSWIWR